MTGTATTRVIGVVSAFVLLVACMAIGQPTSKQSSLPDAPNPQTVDRPEMLRAFADTARLPVTTLAPADGLLAPKFAPKYDPLHLEAERSRKEASNLSPWTPALLKHHTAFHGGTNNSLMGRATDAASSVFITRDEDGRHKLNTPYLLRVLTVATAHVADRPYWRRSVSQPFADFGSTLGNDAGMNVLHAFQPGLLQLMKNHEPRFVSRIEQRSHQK